MALAHRVPFALHYISNKWLFRRMRVDESLWSNKCNWCEIEFLSTDGIFVPDRYEGFVCRSYFVLSWVTVYVNVYCALPVNVVFVTVSTLFDDVHIDVVQVVTIEAMLRS